MSRLQPSTITLTTTILSPQGEAISSVRQNLRLAANASSTDSQTITLTKPDLWSIEMPQLYKAITQIAAGDSIIDQVETTFGVRSIHMRC
jgi:beta-galactosidase